MCSVGGGANAGLTLMLVIQQRSFSAKYSQLSFYVSRKAQESQKEMKLLLDMYRSAPKEQRDKVQLMAAEKKAKAEVNFTSLPSSMFAYYLKFQALCTCAMVLLSSGWRWFLFLRLLLTREIGIVWR